MRRVRVECRFLWVAPRVWHLSGMLFRTNFADNRSQRLGHAAVRVDAHDGGQSAGVCLGGILGVWEVWLW